MNRDQAADWSPVLSFQLAQLRFADRLSCRWRMDDDGDTEREDVLLDADAFTATAENGDCPYRKPARSYEQFELYACFAELFGSFFAASLGFFLLLGRARRRQQFIERTAGLCNRFKLRGREQSRQRDRCGELRDLLPVNRRRPDFLDALRLAQLFDQLREQPSRGTRRAACFGLLFRLYFWVLVFSFLYLFVVGV
jgi:hypothetical protein